MRRAACFAWRRAIIFRRVCLILPLRIAFTFSSFYFAELR